MGHHLCRTLNHRCLDGRAQFPPTIRQPERLAAGNWRGQAEIHRKVQLGVQSARRSGCDASKQKLAAQCIVTPPAESPDSLTLTNLGLAPALQPGQDVLGSGMACRMTSTVHPQMKLCGQRWWKMQWVDDPCPCPKFVPEHPNLSHPGALLFAAVNPPRPQSHPRCPK